MPNLFWTFFQKFEEFFGVLPIVPKCCNDNGIGFDFIKQTEMPHGSHMSIREFCSLVDKWIIGNQVSFLIAQSKQF